MDLHYLEIFNTVATYQSYKKASEVLHISQPALSIQIKKLEEQIGLKLFDKVGNRIHLNQNGLLLKDYTNRIFVIVEELEETISATLTDIEGTLNIGASNTPGSYILPSIIGMYKKQYPKTKINLHIGNTAEIAELITSGALDIAINGGTCTYNDNIFSEQLLSDKLVIIASTQNTICKQGSITRSDLSKMNFIVHETDSQLYIYYLNFINDYNLNERISMHLGNTEAIKKAVASDLGISLMPYVAVRQEIELGLLKEVNFPDYHVSYPYSLIYNKKKKLSVTAKKFIELLQDTLK